MAHVYQEMQMFDQNVRSREDNKQLQQDIGAEAKHRVPLRGQQKAGLAIVLAVLQQFHFACVTYLLP